MKIRYTNSQGEVVDLLNFQTRLKDANFHNYTWEYDRVIRNYGVGITRFRKSEKEYEASIIFRGDANTRKENLNHFLEVAEKDIIRMTPGRIIYEDYYIDAFVISSSTYPYNGAEWTQKDVIFLCPNPFWIHEESRSFPPIPSSSKGEAYLDYEHDYPYDYTMPYGGDVIWNVDHYAPCEFLMTVFGPAADPRVLINGHPYQIYTTLDTNEYLQIDSRENKVIKYLANGIQQDIYDLRAKQESVFDPITPGNISVVWPGEFGFDLTLFCERSEPRWKIQSS